MAYKQYNPDKVAVILGTFAAKGLAEGEFVTVEYAEDRRSMQISTDGYGRHIKNLNNSGTVTVRLTDFSPTNDEIMTLETSDVPFIIQIVDKNSTAAHFFAGSCMLAKVPNFVRGKEGTVNEYVFNFTSGVIYQSGAQEY
jgi:hypothetical protein